MNDPQFFEIQADDPERAMTFYKEVFGWRFEKQPGLPVDYWLIATDGIGGGLLPRPSETHGHEGTNAFIQSMRVESFDEAAKKILAHGGEVAFEKFAVPGKCWQGYFIDPDLNTFGIFEVDESAK
jgi:hypothetical protein